MPPYFRRDLDCSHITILYVIIQIMLITELDLFLSMNLHVVMFSVKFGCHTYQHLEMKLKHLIIIFCLIFQVDLGMSKPTLDISVESIAVCRRIGWPILPKSYDTLITPLSHQRLREKKRLLISRINEPKAE